MRALGHRRWGKLAIRRAATASLVFLAAVSCGEDDSAGPSPPRRVAASLRISPATATPSAPGDTVRLTAQALDHQATSWRAPSSRGHRGTCQRL